MTIIALSVLGAFGVIALVGLVCACVEDDKLPPPRPDERDWQGVFMKDFKRR